MKNKCIKYIILFIVFILILLGLPLILNRLILMPKQFEIVGNGKDWLIFWATFFSAIASSIMAIITWLTLKQNSNQLTELKRQWEEDHRAILSFSFIAHDKNIYLKISNIGNSAAFAVKINLSQNFIDAHFSKVIKKSLINLQNKQITLEKGVSKYLFISPVFMNNSSSTTIYEKEYYSGEDINNWLNKNKNIKLLITGSYCEKYSIEETISIDEFIIDNSIVYNDNLTEAVQQIKNGLITQNNNYYTVQKSLDIIAKKLEKNI